MNKQEMYASIYSHETVYRPIAEEHSTLLEVAVGCSWGKCAFCDFAKDKFHIAEPEEIRRRLEVLAQLEPEAKRVFLLGENAFVLSAEQLLEIMEMTRRYLPQVTQFAAYARADDVLRKTPDQLRQLRQAGMADLHIGLESGSDSILTMMNKGETAFQLLTAFRNLDGAGIGYYVTVILGLGGRAYRNLHVMETARLLNQIHPKQIWCLKLSLWQGTPLDQMVKRGEFEVMSPQEVLGEEIILLEHLNLSNCMYIDTTVLDTYTVMGNLPKDKEAMLSALYSLAGEQSPRDRMYQKMRQMEAAERAGEAPTHLS